MYYATSMSMRAEPSDMTYDSLDNFMFSYKPLPREKDYHLHKNDLIALKPRGDTAGIDKFIMKVIMKDPNRVTRVWIIRCSKENLIFHRIKLMSLSTVSL